MPVLRTFSAVFLMLCSSGCGGGSGASSTLAAAPRSVWVAAWAQPDVNAVPSAANPAGSEQTFRIVFKPSVGSRGTVRLHFSNLFGSQPVTVGAARLAVKLAGAAIDPATSVAVTFGGQPGITLAPGSSVTSDELRFRYAYGAVLALTEYVSGSWAALDESNQATGIVTSYATPSGAGNASADTSGAAFTQKMNDTFVINRLDVLGDYFGTLATVGSSTVAGFGSDLDGFDDWTDDIAKNLHAAGRDDLAVVDLGIPPNAVVPAADLASTPSVEERFDRDVLALPGIAGVVQAGGDIELKGSCLPASTLVAADQSLTARAHAAGIKIILATIAPTTYCRGTRPAGGGMFPAGSGQDAERAAFNAWVLSTTPTTVDGVLVQPPTADATADLSTPVTDPQNSGYLVPGLSTDDAHLDAAGQATQAAQIPLGLFH